jgi:hypothetical protein
LARRVVVWLSSRRSTNLRRIKGAAIRTLREGKLLKARQFSSRARSRGSSRDVSRILSPYRDWTRARWCRQNHQNTIAPTVAGYAGHAGRETRLLPCLPEALERPAVFGPMKHPRNNAPGFLLQRLSDGLLGLEHGAELWRHHEHPPLKVLRRAGVEPDAKSWAKWRRGHRTDGVEGREKPGGQGRD